MKPIKSFFLFLLTLSSIGISLQANAYDASGEFMTIHKGDPVKGSLKIVHDREGDSYKLTLGDDFASSMGPDLFFVLHKEIVPTSYTPENSVLIAPVGKLHGAQVYELPHGVDPMQYRAIVVWCRQFDVTFGSAALIAKEWEP